VLQLEFDGILNDGMHGFYRSTYTAQDGSTKVIGTTQFESTDARRAFPCFDQPDFKAIFQITIVAPSTLTILSNTNESARQPLSGGLVSVTFQPTPVMSTYLVAFIVGDLEYVEDTDGNVCKVLVLVIM
jgi:aminopeptidase N